MSDDILPYALLKVNRLSTFCNRSNTFFIVEMWGKRQRSILLDEAPPLHYRFPLSSIPAND